MLNQMEKSAKFFGRRSLVALGFLVGEVTGGLEQSGV